MVRSRVFISYHRSDSAIADAARSFLVSHGISAWMDRFDIPAGAYWPDEIDRGLQDSEIVLGILSPDAVTSRNVKNEWDWALQNDRQLILLLARPTAIPHRYISLNYIDATGPDPAPALAHLGSTLAGYGAAPEEPKPAVPETRYAQSGNVAVAYQVFGEGPLDFIFAPGYLSHVEHSWTLPPLATYLHRLGALARVIMFDKRGTGMSDRSGGIATMAERMDDIRAVMDAAGSERAVIYGLSEGVPLAITFAATYPARTVGLILYGGSATYQRHPDYPWGTPLEEFEAQIAEDERTLASRWGTPAFTREVLRHFSPTREPDDALVTWFASLMRLGASPGAAVALDRMNLGLDVRDVLPTIGVPTLVINREGDQSGRQEEARYIAERIPGAELVILPGDDHFAFLGDQEGYFEAIASFLGRLQDGNVTFALPRAVAEDLANLVARWDLAGAALSLEIASERERRALRALGDVLRDHQG